MTRLVLAGAGHAHAQVLLDACRAPLRGVELVVVSPQPLAPYSGMVPGWLAGLYRHDEIVIDFAALCAAAGARWVPAALHSVDAGRRHVWLDSGERLPYDLLSLNVGATLNPPPDAAAAATVLSMRPLSALHEAYGRLLARWAADPSDRPFTVTAVGGGAAGFESLLAVLARLRAVRPDRPVHGGLVTRSAAILPGLSAPARRAALQVLARAGVNLQLGTGWCDTIARSSDLLLWATGAEAHAWQRDDARRGGLAVCAQGFVRIDAQLRSVSHPQVYAVGDGAQWSPPLPKAGVFAVRMGPVLSRNLRAALGQPGALPSAVDAVATRYRPQRQHLVLLSTADRRAIASRGPFGLAGGWAWRWKDHIDRAFVRRFSVAPAVPTAAWPTPPGDTA